MAQSWSIKDLEYWEAAIHERVQEFGLDCYPQEFEVCDANQMLSIMSYSGMPSHYPHWSYGKAFERQKTLYNYALSGLPYEMVINSNPCLAYLMRDNSLCLQITTIAHVYGHNDFFKRNFNFSFTKAERVIEMFKAHAQRVRAYQETPSIGRRRVERILDAAHALSLQCRRNPAIRKLAPDEHRERILSRTLPKDDPYAPIHKKKDVELPDLSRYPLEPEEDLLAFIRDYNPRLESWERDLLSIVIETTNYFLPQIETKVINEGWASYWHRTIMNSLDLPQDIMMEFLVRHNQVVRPIPGDVNPYHVGLKIWDDIEKRYSQMSEADFREKGESPKTAREKMFEVRDVERDSSFLRRFLSEDLLREMDLFKYQRNEGDDIVVSAVADEEDWGQVKDTLITNIGMGRIPTIKVIDGDYGEKRELLLQHIYDGRELQLEYAQHTLRYVQQLWGRKTHLQTRINKEDLILSIDQDGTFTKTSLSEKTDAPLPEPSI